MRFARQWNTAAQLSALTIAVAAISVLAVGWITYETMARELSDLHMSALNNDAEIVALRVEEDLNAVRGDAAFLTATPPVEAYLRSVTGAATEPVAGLSSPEEALARLEMVARSMMRSRAAYQQIRLLNGGGREVFRLDRTGDGFVRVAQADLQDKSRRDYYLEAKSSARPGHVYVSRLDLNREFGIMTMPPKPMLRFVAPVFEKSGRQPLAFVVINVQADRFWDRRTFELKDNRQLYVVRANGDFVVHPDMGRRFSSELGGQFGVSDEWPEVARFTAIGQIPANYVSHPNKGEAIAAGTYLLEYDPDFPDRQLLFVASSGLGLIEQPLNALRIQVIIISLVIIAFVIAATLLLASLATRRLRSLTEAVEVVADGRFVALDTIGDRNDEIGRLGSAIVYMVHQLRKSRDETEAAQAQLEQNAAFLSSVIDNTPSMIFVKEAKEMRFVRVNQAFEAITGLSASEMLGRTSLELFPEAIARRFVERDRQALVGTGEMDTAEETLINGDGEERVILTRRVVIRNGSGEPEFLLGLFDDITELKNAVAGLELNERRFRTIVETTVDGMVTIDNGGTIETFNRSASQIFGYPEAEVIGRNVKMLMPEPDHSRHDGYLSRYLETRTPRILGTPTEVIGLHQDGTLIPLSLSIAEFESAGETKFGATLRDLTEEKKRDRLLLEAKQAAEEANLAKSQFLASMSHELRTPLNAIIGYSEMLVEDALSEAGMDDPVADLERIQTAGRHLLMLINDVLDLSKIEAGGIELEFMNVAIGGLVSELADTVRGQVEANGSQLTVTLPESLETIRTDPTRVRQILMNLLGNAAKFTSDGKVELTVNRVDSEASGPQILFKVSDTGIGIEPDKLDRVFEAFAQADSSTTRTYGGTGLGLAIVRRNCELLGGRVEVTSTLGEGSEFRVYLPWLEQDESSAETPMRRIEFREGKEQAVVLVIDDRDTARRLMVDHLKKAGFSAFQAASGPEGLEMARELKPCAIVLDVVMPEMDGWTVLSRLKSDPELSTIPVILCTIVDEKQKAYALGASDYLMKPVDRRQLVEILRRYCTDAPCRLLIVEDDAPTRELLHRVAGGVGWRVEEAADGREALESIVRNTPDLILLDLMMPDMDGFDVIDALQNDTGLQQIPVVVVTAKEITAEDRRRLQGYVQVIVEKDNGGPFTLVGRITELLTDAAGRIR